MALSASSHPDLKFPKAPPLPLEREDKRTRIESKNKAVKRAVQVRDQHTCRVCGKASESTHEIHSLGAGGKVSLKNSIAVCGDGTRGCHGKLQRYEILVIGHNAKSKLKFVDNGRKRRSA